MKLAISGKGGVGKTTIAATLTKLFAQTHKTVYAIDGDPDACLAAGVGIPDEVIAEMKPVVEMREIINKKSAGGGAFYVLNPDMDDVLEEYCLKVDNIRFFRMGGVKKGGEACYCRENTFLHAMVSSLLLNKDDVVIMDMGAGIEHLSRGTAKGVELMLVVVEPSKNSVNTAKLVQKMAADLGIKKTKIIGNKIRSEKEQQFIEKNFHADEILGFVKFDEDVWESAMEQGPAAELKGQLLDSMKKVQEKILEEVGKEGGN